MLLVPFITSFIILRLYSGLISRTIFIAESSNNYSCANMRLLIAERSPILRKRLTRLFSDLGYISLVAFVQDLAEVQKIASEEHPDVIVVDLDFPNYKNLKILAALKDKIIHPKVIIVLTEATEPRYLSLFQDSGADIVFNKKDDLNKFVGHLNLMDGVIKNTPLV